MTTQQGNQSNHTQSRNQQPWKSYYDTIPIPAKLIDDRHTDPIDLGIYLLIARQYLIHKQPVPLSQHDITKFDPPLTAGRSSVP
jgi:hypothetical protein